MSTGCFVKPITGKLFRAVIAAHGLPPMSEFLLMMKLSRHRGAEGEMVRPSLYPYCDIYINRVGGHLRKMGVDPVCGREAFMETLFKKIYCDPKLYARCFVHEDPQDFFATVLLHSGPPPGDGWEFKTQRAEHEVGVKAFLMSLRAGSNALPMEQFVRVCDFKYEQFVQWCKNGGKFDAVDSDTETEVED